jgi:hypothetical protein
MINQWYLINILMLQSIWGAVEYDDNLFTWIKIHHFDLPAVYYQKVSILLFMTPGYNIDNFKDYNFFVDLNLKRRDGVAPPFVHENDEYNNLYYQGYARLSFHLDGFRPTADVVSGDNYLELAKAVYHFLGQDKP